MKNIQLDLSRTKEDLKQGFFKGFFLEMFQTISE